MQSLSQGQTGEQPSFAKYFLEDPSLIQHMQDKQQKKIILYDLPQIQQYRKLNKPVVSEEKKRIIKEKLDLEQQSLQQTKERQKRNQFFLNYSQNPFINLDPYLKNSNFTNKATKQTNTPNQGNRTNNGNTQQIGEKEREGATSSLQRHSNDKLVHDIVYELNVLKEKDFKPQFHRMKDQFKNLKKNADLFSSKIIELSSKKEQFDYFRNKTFEDKELIRGIFERGFQLASIKKTEKERDQSRNRSSTLTPQQVKDNKDGYMNPTLSQLPQNTMTFDEIINLKEENFFMKTDHYKNLNIFKIAFNKNQKEIIGKELLNKYYFSFTSMVEKLQKIKIPIYRDISRMARKISLNVSTGKQDRFDYMDSYELSFKTNALTFVDLMSVASGRFTPEFVYKTTNFDVEQNVIKQKSETSSQQEQEEIFYEDNTKNISVRFYNKGEEEQQILNYLKLEYNSREISYQSQCQQYKKSIHSQLKMKEKLVSTTIQDKDLHGVINRSVKKQLKQFVNMDEKDIEIDRLIRMNKTHKTKNVSIKLQKILEAFELKRQHDQVIQKLGIIQQMDTDDRQDPEISDEKKQKLNQVNRKVTPSKYCNHKQNLSKSQIRAQATTPVKAIAKWKY